jgi:hypothetical protein
MLVNAVAWPTSCSALDNKGKERRKIIHFEVSHKLDEVTILSRDIPRLKFFIGEHRKPTMEQVEFDPLLVQCEILELLSHMDNEVKYRIRTRLWKSKLLSGPYTGGTSVALTPTPPAG